MTISRRSLLNALPQGLGTILMVNWRLPLAWAGEKDTASNEAGPLTVRVASPLDAETPVREFVSCLTPNDRFFVRSHFGPPPQERIAEEHWRLRVGGLVEQSREFRMDDLRQMEPVTVTAVVQCSGNGRAFHRPKVPGVQWERGAVGNARWTGVRLREVLSQAGVKEQARHVQFQGADRPVLASVPLFIRSIPLMKALHPDTVLAYEMNGRPLPLLHGALLRVVAPGWMADSCIKWLTDIVLQEDEAQGYFMQTAYRVPMSSMEPGASGSEPSRPVEAMVVKSLIASPADGDRVGLGQVLIQGVAWSGEATVVTVEVSIDEGKSWEPARLVGEDQPYGWRQWQLIWQSRTAGTFTILCRATDARGETQPEMSPWNPSGFLWNGWDRVTVTVVA